MKYEATLLALAGLAAARDVSLYNSVVKREVPQEHSHQAILDITNTNLQLDNPLEIQDAVFSLLGNKAAAAGAPNVQNLDCLQQLVADQAFTNAKAAGDVDGQANAIMFRALERNTGSVGLASVLCNETATNPEIAAITQHQDPASDGAAAGNKQIALDVAAQLSSIGADPNLAINTGTFAPGDKTDNTGAGNTCDDANDAAGCIISQNLLVPDVTEDEIAAAVGSRAASGAASAADSASASNATASAADSASSADDSAACDDAAAADSGSASNATANAADSSADSASSADDSASSSDAAAASDSNAAASATNVQAFTGTLGGAAPPVESTAGSDRPFSVNGATFVNSGAALQRSCAVQHNACANAANAGGADFSVSDCGDQEDACNAANAAKKVRRSGRFHKVRQAAGLDFGSCSNPAIAFGVQKDRPNEDAFAAVDQANFNHGSALAINVISTFICQQLDSSCKAAAVAVSACDDAAASAKALKGQAAADAFNSALGVSA